MKRCMALVWLVVLLTAGTGCSAFMHGYTTNIALNRYLLVRKEPQTSGYRRLEYIQWYRSSIKDFIGYHGSPDFIYEFKAYNDRPGLRLYYTKKNLVYIFVERNWEPDSMFFVEQRPLTEFESQVYAQLLEGNEVRLEQDGSANERQPFSSGTNTTSSAAGSRR